MSADLAEAGAICAASMAATVAVIFAAHRAERSLAGFAIWTSTAAAALAAGALIATLAAEIGIALAR